LCADARWLRAEGESVPLGSALAPIELRVAAP